MFDEFEFNKPTVFTITSVNGIPLPKDYLAFMHEHNGGEGPLGENAYMQLVPLEELEDFNNDYEISTYLKNIVLFGTDLGGILFGYDISKKLYCAVDSCSMTKEDIRYAGSDFDGFIRAVDQGEL